VRKAMCHNALFSKRKEETKKQRKKMWKKTSAVD